MLIPLDYLVKRYDFKIKGAIIAGAHYLEEYDDFVSHGIKNIIAFEPCRDSFSYLVNRFSDNDNVLLFNYALSDQKGEQDMYVSKDNQGQSNSLLKPKLHISQHPDIVFNDTEKVMVETLDSFSFSKLYDMLYMDVQGNEGAVLKGATETLKNIDVVYTEVNRAEVYENCMQINELDELLSGFVRVETKWAGNWGDSLYLSKRILNK